MWCQFNAKGAPDRPHIPDAQTWEEIQAYCPSLNSGLLASNFTCWQYDVMSTQDKDISDRILNSIYQNQYTRIAFRENLKEETSQLQLNKPSSEYGLKLFPDRVIGPLVHHAQVFLWTKRAPQHPMVDHLLLFPHPKATSWFLTNFTPKNRADTAGGKPVSRIPSQPWHLPSRYLPKT